MHIYERDPSVTNKNFATKFKAPRDIGWMTSKNKGTNQRFHRATFNPQGQNQFVNTRFMFAPCSSGRPFLPALKLADLRRREEMMAANAHKVFYNPAGENSYLGALAVSEPEKVRLRAARDEIRETLRSGFRDWAKFVEDAQLFEAAAVTGIPNTGSASLRPKFRMQGSWSYDTLNRINQNPPQKIDLDDGVFLPVSFISKGGTAHPIVASAGYFLAVEKILAPLCSKRGWSLITDKPSCVRIVIDRTAHIDLALYAIPDEEFSVLVEKASAAARFNDANADDIQTIFDEIYPTLPADQIMLAHREEKWKPSDPRKLEDWFRGAVEDHGAQLRRVCRYLKAWRDHQWPKCKLSSIALMACAVSAYEAADGSIPENRDDLAVQMVAARLAQLLQGRIDNPVVEGQFFDEGWSTDIRSDLVSKAQELKTRIDAAISTKEARSAIENLRAALGQYLPDDEALVQIDSEVKSPAILTSGILKDFGKDRDAVESVKKGGDSRYG